MCIYILYLYITLNGILYSIEKEWTKASLINIEASQNTMLKQKMPNEWIYVKSSAVYTAKKDKTKLYYFGMAISLVTL